MTMTTLPRGASFKVPVLAAAVLLMLQSAIPTSTVGAGETPNFVLVMCDDLGWGDVGFNGNQKIRTPHLDEMAANGLRFTRFYAASAVCSPTRGSVVTGRHPFRYGIPHANRGHLKPQELTLAEWLKTQGYRTGHFGKWHLGTLTKTIRDSNRGGPKGAMHYSPPWKNGFEVCFSTEAKTPTYDPMRKPVGKAPNIGWDHLTDDDPSEPYGTFYWNEQGQRVTENLDGDDSRVIMDRAVPFIERAAAEQQSFFAVIWFHTPHLPVVAGPKHAALYKQYDSYTKNYYGCITAMDEQIGRLRATLRKAGVAKNTLVAFCSDNGPEGNSKAPGSTGPFRGRKRDLLEGGVRVPALIEWPAEVDPGDSTDFPAVTSDYFPTIVSLANKEPLAGFDRPMDGVSLSHVLRDPSRQMRKKPIGFRFGNQWAWHEGRYKLIHIGRTQQGNNQQRKQGQNRQGPQREPRPQLFDLQTDPGETEDLASELPERVASMTAAYRQWMKSCEASEQGRDYPTETR